MPFVVRTVQPKFLSRNNKLLDTAGSPLVKEGELDAVINNTLCNCLKQLGSVVSVAGDIFKQLNEELVAVSEKTDALKARMARLNAHTEEFDPKLVTVQAPGVEAQQPIEIGNRKPLMAKEEIEILCPNSSASRENKATLSF
ncbi:hypothetical protein M8J76_013409 [Diaphorina citri]|nr:hypothetical protein M8J76_013409 [Diaphorina citri]